MSRSSAEVGALFSTRMVAAPWMSNAYQSLMRSVAPGGIGSRRGRRERRDAGRVGTRMVVGCDHDDARLCVEGLFRRGRIVQVLILGGMDERRAQARCERRCRQARRLLVDH